jgi:hypothetical protein
MSKGTKRESPEQRGKNEKGYFLSRQVLMTASAQLSTLRLHE